MTKQDKRNAAAQTIDELQPRKGLMRDGVRHQELFRLRMKQRAESDRRNCDVITMLKVAIDRFENRTSAHPLIALSEIVIHGTEAESEAAWTALKGFIL